MADQKEQTLIEAIVAGVSPLARTLHVILEGSCEHKELLEEAIARLDDIEKRVVGLERRGVKRGT